MNVMTMAHVIKNAGTPLVHSPVIATKITSYKQMGKHARQKVSVVINVLLIYWFFQKIRLCTWDVICTTFPALLFVRSKKSKKYKIVFFKRINWLQQTTDVQHANQCCYSTHPPNLPNHDLLKFFASNLAWDKKERHVIQFWRPGSLISKMSDCLTNV